MVDEVADDVEREQADRQHTQYSHDYSTHIKRLLCLVLSMGTVYTRRRHSTVTGKDDKKRFILQPFVK